MVVPLPIYWYHSKSNWLRYNFAADSFYIMKLCSRLFVLYCPTCPKDSLLSGGGRLVRAKISGGSCRPWGIFFGLHRTRHILLHDSANCTVLRAVILTQYQRVTDRRRDRRNCCRYYSTCNASIVHAVKRSSITLNKNSTRAFQRAINQGSKPPLTSSKWGWIR